MQKQLPGIFDQTEISLQEVEYQGLRFTVLRADLLHPLVSGNKAWKLKLNIAAALEQKCTRLVTFGGAYSNHLLAVAACASETGLLSLGVVRGDEPITNKVLERCNKLGMELVQVTRQQYRNKEELLRKLNLVKACDYVIPEGGTNSLAVRGCADAVPTTPQFDHIFLPAGTGGTLAGFAIGAAEKQLTAHVHGVPVLKPGDFLKDVVKGFAPMTTNWSLELDYAFGGFARTTPELLNFVKSFTESTGIEIEPIYSGKMFFALTDLLSRGKLPATSKILAVHTGGILY